MQFMQTIYRSLNDFNIGRCGRFEIELLRNTFELGMIQKLLQSKGETMLIHIINSSKVIVTTIPFLNVYLISFIMGKNTKSQVL